MNGKVSTYGVAELFKVVGHVFCGMHNMQLRLSINLKPVLVLSKTMLTEKSEGSRGFIRDRKAAEMT